jgi:hypothetical protein
MLYIEFFTITRYNTLSGWPIDAVQTDTACQDTSTSIKRVSDQQLSTGFVL